MSSIRSLNLNQNFTFEKFEIINFINLSHNEKELVRNWRNSESIRKWSFNERLITQDEHNNFLDSLQKDTNKSYWLVKKDTQYLGVINFTNIDFYNRNAFLGIYTNPEEKITGSGSILLSLILEIAFNIFNFHTLKLEVIENNERAIRLYKKFGFEIEGRLREFVFKNGRWLDVLIMGKINPEEKSL